MRLSGRLLRWPIILAVSIALISLIPPARGLVLEAVSPVVLLLRQKGEGIIDGVKTLTLLGSLPKENGALRAKVTELSALEIQNNELRHENNLLRQELHLLSSDASKSLIAAQVVSRSVSVSQQSILVDKGTNDGFKEGMAVISQGYLVGRVVETTNTTSRIMLITSAESLLPIVLQDSRSVGLLKGGTEGLIVDEIPRDVTIKPEEAIVTSPVGDVIKSGIPVGKIQTLVSGKSDVFQSARVASPIDFSRLEVVFGVKP